MSRAARMTGIVLSVIGALFMLMDITMHATKPQPVVAAFAQLGLPAFFAPLTAIAAGICLVLYVIPRTAVLGAVLFTGYLGGAIAIQLRAGMPAFETAFPLAIAVILWGGLWLRDPRARALF